MLLSVFYVLLVARNLAAHAEASHSLLTVDDGREAADATRSGLFLVINCFLGQLFDRVDIIKPVSNVHLYVRTCVRPSVCPQKVSAISMRFSM